MRDSFTGELDCKLDDAVSPIENNIGSSDRLIQGMFGVDVVNVSLSNTIRVAASAISSTSGSSPTKNESKKNKKND